MSISYDDRFSIRTLVLESGAGSPPPDFPPHAAVASERPSREARRSEYMMTPRVSESRPYQRKNSVAAAIALVAMLTPALASAQSEGIARTDSAARDTAASNSAVRDSVRGDSASVDSVARDSLPGDS